MTDNQGDICWGVKSIPCLGVGINSNEYLCPNYTDKVWICFDIVE